ncbi:MAG: gluconate 2-dehydrogenase subunit 3 family protein [Hyphomicrobiales bacterium]|nr:gluconate 2-dehydrogenase subunit 3 family protein [Hyphomicrobiales bacterium]MBV9431575.1 gluconate 2-dehydrogenase subunit 3 family protein [Hyphomicrobiales bacterium]
MTKLSRRELLATTALLLATTARVEGRDISGQVPWRPNAGAPPQKITPGGWLFFTLPEAAAIEAMVDRIIPPDAEAPGGKDAGCAVFIDRQLAGPYGHQEGLYTRPPFIKGSREQGPQSEGGPAQVYKTGLAALDRFCRSGNYQKGFAELDPKRQDEILQGLEDEKIQLDGADGKAFFQLVALDAQQGFFADPLYGGNRDMCGWKMIGFPGARYDYRDWVTRHNEPYPYPPVSIMGRSDWLLRKG